MSNKNNCKPPNELSPATEEFILYLSKNLTKRDIYICKIQAWIVATLIKLKIKIIGGDSK